MTEKALAKLAEEFGKGSYGSAANIMKQSVRDALETFIRQDEEFAQAVAQGGTFEECMKTVATNAGRGISDLEAYRRAVQFYFPGADVEFTMNIRVNPHERISDNGGITLNFADLFQS